MKSSRFSSRDPRVRTAAVAVVASGFAAAVVWSAARHTTVPSPAAAPQASASAAPLASVERTVTAADEPVLPPIEATDKILADIPDLRTASGASAAKVDGVIARLKDAARAQPNDAETWGRLGDALTQKSRVTADPNYDDSAEKCYAKSLSLAPQNPDALLGMANVSGARRQFARSGGWARKALATSPRLPAAYGLIADADVESGDYAAAAQASQKMLDLRSDAPSYSAAARYLYLMGDRRKAIWMINKAAKIGGLPQEDLAGSRAQLADMYLREGATLPAQQIVEPALKSLPGNFDLLLERGKIQQAEGDLKGAIDSYEKAVAVTPTQETLVALGDLYAATGDTQKAEAVYDRVEKAHEIRKQHGLADELPVARFFADHDRQMPRALTIAESHADTQNPVDADNVAWVFYRSGKTAEAKTLIDRALSKGEPDPSRLYHAGMIYARLGDRFPAQEYLNRAISLDPHFSLRDTPIAIATLHDLGSKPRLIDAPSPVAPAVAVAR